MELLDRYLNAVRRHLPWERQNDIIAELRANLEAQLEDKEAELGRPLSAEEMKVWLMQIGPPILVAARYKRQQYLIGPGVFPIYWLVLRLALAWCTVIYAIAKLVDIVMNGLGAAAVAHAIAQLPGVLLTAAAVVTLVFAVIDHAHAWFPARFAPATGMANGWPREMAPPFDVAIGEGRPKRTFAGALIEVIFGCLFLPWLLLIPHYPYLLLGPGAAYLPALPFKLAPVWWTFYWCMVALSALQLAWNIAGLWSGRWRRSQRALTLATNATGLIPLLVLLTAPGHALVLLKNPAVDMAAHGAELAKINQISFRVFEVFAALVLMQLLWGLGRMTVEAYRKRRAER